MQNAVIHVHESQRAARRLLVPEVVTVCDHSIFRRLIGEVELSIGTDDEVIETPGAQVTHEGSADRLRWPTM